MKKETTMKKLILIAGCSVALAMSQVAVADYIEVGFQRLTTTSGYDVSSQLRMEVAVDEDAQTVGFKFFNDVGISSVISEIYFDDGMLKEKPAIATSGGDVEYVQGATPENLPGGENLDPDFKADIIFSAEPDNPEPHHGVRERGQWVQLTYGLGEFKDLDAVVSALANGDLRVGLHVTAINGNDSDSYINSRPLPPMSIPDSGLTAMLLGVGMVVLGFVAKRKA
ncbi:MAG: hypothetical protein QHJ82_14820 [Verrucomicrobiota bacterium]|nr:hypothetical protein [Verrucomicrobiota bacterium]